ncbi:ATP/GTP-binding protein [Fictibacillus macauensis ZFHKF-1]|uniref:ATP/GTP-binding protein n=1 Tax=Fictibacillus macauensis ZFHKF-1 TaxID=1196324 RepID=I8UHA0_9BACL|nr:HpcH/HpaI aldolase/citrate lyase family protein [Fictibacillus macauensis]EIT86198.1 ATP/GTP-binding protein [Fictibacillus macauensis ZFHKF-1]
MRHFQYLSQELEQRLFYQLPQSFSKNSDKAWIAHGLGAALYMPATRARIAQDIVTKKHRGLMTMILCLEDSIEDERVPEAEHNIIQELTTLARYVANGVLEEEALPFLFIRVRNEEQMERLARGLDQSLRLVTGFVFPKFTSENGPRYLAVLAQLNGRYRTMLYGMPILESPVIMYKESRLNELQALLKLFLLYEEWILNIRIGATDFSGLFGLRRRPDETIYDVGVIADCFADLVNTFRREPYPFVLSGPVWEYFESQPSLQSFTGLLKEVRLDQLNGFIGKTIIHPTHIIPVQAMYTVSHEEYCDAKSILERGAGGVMKSTYSNKMNEAKPHYAWAKNVMQQSKIYGVLRHDKTSIDLLSHYKEVPHLGFYRS